MGIWKLGRDVELEIVVVGNHRVSQFDDGTASLLEGLLQEDGFQGRVEIFSDVFQETWFAESDGIFKTAKKVFVGEFNHIQCIVLLL